jgi:hypothetical protein
LIRPGRVISSAMPCTAPCSTSLAALERIEQRGHRRRAPCSSFWFGMVISESTCLASSSMPCVGAPRRACGLPC